MKIVSQIRHIVTVFIVILYIATYTYATCMLLDLESSIVKHLEN